MKLAESQTYSSLSDFYVDFHKIASFCKNAISGKGKDYIFGLKNSKATTPQPVSLE